MNPLLQSIAMNKEGVRLLNLGDTSGAIAVFQHAVAVMRNVAAAHAENPCELFDNLASEEMRTSFPRRDQRPQDLVGLQSDVCYIYNRPLVIPTVAHIKNQEDLDSFVQISSSFIIFNFALVCHQYGKIHGDEASLKRAGCLYNLTVKSLANGVGCDQAHFALQCLALNNLAQLHYDQCDFRKSQSCLEIMYDMVIRTNCLDSYLSDEETEELMLNLVHMQAPVAACAA
jgi:hypothetical protein